MTMQNRIETLIRANIKGIEKLEVINESAKHRGHAGDDGSGQTHFKVMVVAAHFEGLSRVERQRAINEILKSCFQEGLHALSTALLAPAEI